MYTSRFLACVGVLSCLPLLASFPASAQSYPVKPIRLIMPFNAGAPSDVLGRTISQKISEYLGQNIVPDNRAGAGGNMGVGAVAKATPDGYTLLLSSPAIALGPALYKNLPYDPIRDFVPVARVATIDNLILVHPSVPAKSLKEFVDLARSSPGKYKYGSGGAGTSNHLANELLKYNEKIDLIHVPYKSATLATLALAGGEVDEVVVGVTTALPLLKAGKVRALAILAEKRAPTLPDLPSAVEAGYPNFLITSWYGLFAPAGTSRDIIAKLNRETLRALEAPEVRTRLAAVGIDPWPGSSQDLANLVKSELARYTTLAKTAGIKPE